MGMGHSKQPAGPCSCSMLAERIRAPHVPKTGRSGEHDMNRSLHAATDRIFVICLSVWFVANLLTLTRFPHAHSDEAWLAGLSRAILASGSLRTTEPFFDLFPRQPHMMKVLYHLLQAPFLTMPGPALFQARLPSLLAASATLAILYRSFRARFVSGPLVLLFPAILGFHVQFLYAAHFARQESLLLFFLVLAGDLYDRTSKKSNFWVVPMCIGFSATLHPNALLLAAILGTRLVADILIGSLPVRKLLVFSAVLTGWGLLLVAGSLLLNPSFFAAYGEFGASLSVDASPGDRWQNFVAYFIKLYQRISGTYWLPDIRGWLLIGLLAIPASMVMLLRGHLMTRRRQVTESARDRTAGIFSSLAELIGFLAGMLIIGRFNPTAIVFALPPVLHLFSRFVPQFLTHPDKVEIPQVLRRLSLKGITWVACLFLIFCSAAGGIVGLSGFLMGRSPSGPLSVHTSGRIPGDSGYEAYLAEVRASLGEGAVVLGNLSAGFAFDGMSFYDIRNLAPVRGVIPDPAAYLAERDINTVFWYEEYDYVLRNPQWRILYESEPDAGDAVVPNSGNRTEAARAESEPGKSAVSDSETAAEAPGFLAGLREVLDRHGTVIRQFEAPVYGTRIIRYMDGDTPWQVTVFRIDPETISETRRFP